MMARFCLIVSFSRLGLHFEWCYLVQLSDSNTAFAHSIDGGEAQFG